MCFRMHTGVRRTFKNCENMKGSSIFRKAEIKLKRKTSRKAEMLDTEKHRVCSRILDKSEKVFWNLMKV